MGIQTEQIGKEKQEYYARLQKSLKPDAEIIKNLEDLMKDISEEELGEELQGYIDMTKNILDCMKITIPLNRAYQEMLLEYVPEWAESDAQNYTARSAEYHSFTHQARRDDMFDILQLFSKTNRERLINCVHGSQKIKDDLSDALKDEDKEGFIKALKGDCDYSILSHWLFQIEFISQRLQYMNLALKNIFEDDSESTDTFAAELETVRRIIPQGALATLMESEYDEVTKEADGDDDSFDTEKIITGVKYCFAQIAYEYDSASFFAKEARILKPILESDDYKRMYEENKELIEQIAREYDGEVATQDDGSNAPTVTPVDAKPESDSAPGDFYQVPDNFFNSKSSPNDLEYFELTRELQNTEKFNSILEVILGYGHLDPSAENMRLFIYRLTGRNRPEGELPKIEWAGQTAALFYIIREMTTQKKGKYEKMKQYFEIRYSRSDFSQEADNASKEFRYKLNEIYSGFKLKESV